MSGYRFCRTDDAALLVDAYNRCYRVHFEGAPVMTADDFKRATREENLWASSCMVAVEGDEPIGVLLSGKRRDASTIFSIGVHPAHRGKGHGRHLLESLSRKLAILGPPGITAEVPAGWSGVRSFFERCGYRVAARYADFVRAAASPGGDGAGFAAVGLDELVEAGALDPAAPRSWARSHETLANRRAELEGLAVVSDVRIEAWALFRARPDGGAEVAGLGAAPGEDAQVLLRALLDRGIGRRSPLAVPRVSEAEVNFSRLESWGFERAAEYVGYETVASPG